MSDRPTIQVLVELTEGEQSAEELERRTGTLREEFLELSEVGSVARASSGPAPDGTRGLDVAAVGALVVAVEPGVEALAKIVGVVRSWLRRGQTSKAVGTSMRITVDGQTIELTPTQDQQAALVEAFLARVAPPGAG